MKLFKRTLVLLTDNVYYIIHDIGWVPNYPNKFSFEINNERTVFYLQKTTKKFGLYNSEI